MMHDLASRFLWTIIDNNQFVGERVEARLLEATIDAPTKRRRPTESRYYNTHVHCGLTSIAAMAYTCLVIVGIAIACTVVGALHSSNFKREKASTALTADFQYTGGFSARRNEIGLTPNSTATKSRSQIQWG
jgi:hypothetical protein